MQPITIDFNPITLADQAMFKQYLGGRRHNLCTFNFTNFFLWKKWDPTGWANVEGAICMKSSFHGLDNVLMPFAPTDEPILRAVEVLQQWYKGRGVPFILTEVSASMKQLLEEQFPGRFVAEEYRPGFNYVYLQSDLATLPGRKYAQKRNHVSRFIRECPDYQFVPLTRELIPGCLECMDVWKAARDTENAELLKEEEGARDGLLHFAELGVTGACLIVGGKVQAFTFGEALNNDTFVIHVEKGNIAIPGIFQAINHFFARDYCSGFTYINREEDMGDPGQRKAKGSYHPCHLEEKYYLYLTEEYNSICKLRR
ncbi:MAG: DUF2156 domain-containing protein [Firmicutes bacterium]|nr:DUF2156 domain-containing protein [Bacillota bacterium]